MTLYAFDDIDDAFDATRAFLWPFTLGRWTRLALVVFFIGGLGGSTPLQFTGGTPGGGGPNTPSALGTPDTIPSLGGLELAVIGVLIGFIALIALLFLLVGSIMEFIFVESLRQEEVTIRRYWGERWGQGLRLFGFRLLVSILTFGSIGLLIVGVLFPALFGDGDFSLSLLLLAILVGIAVVIVSGFVNGFTTVFVVPIMISEDCSLLAAWRQFWPTMIDQWKQYVAYAVMGLVLQIAGRIAASIVTVIATIAVAVPLVIVGLIGAGLLAVSPILGWTVIGIVGVLFVLTVIALVLFISVPVQTFLRYYALLILGDTNEAYDLIDERRRAIRE